MKNNYDKAEERERRFIDWYINTKQEHKIDTISPIGSYNRNDFTFYSGRTFIIAEVKIREFEYDKYPTIILESSKVDALLENFSDEIINQSAKIYYYAVYPKSKKILVFDLLKTPHTKTIEHCPVSTMDPSKGHKRKIMNNYKITDSIININI